MSVMSRIAAGALQRVGWYIVHGYDRVYYAAQFGALALGETYRTINALWNRGQKAYLAGQKATAGTLPAYGPGSAVPGRGPGRTNYRYTVQYTYVNPKWEHPEVRRHTFVLPYLASRAMIDAEGNRIRVPVAYALGVGRSAMVISDEDELVGADVITLERWT